MPDGQRPSAITPSRFPLCALDGQRHDPSMSHAYEDDEGIWRCGFRRCDKPLNDDQECPDGH